MRKIAFICPDDLSTKIFAQSFGDFYSDNQNIEFYTISPIYFANEHLSKVKSRHIDIKMSRFFNIFIDLFYAVNIYRLTRLHKFDCIVTFTTKPNIIGAIAASFAGDARVIIAVRGLGRFFNKPSGIWRNLFTYLYKFSVSRAYAVWFTNPHDRLVFEANGINPKGEVIETRNAINLLEYSRLNVDELELARIKENLNITNQDKVVLLVGRLIWSKGIREFVEASYIVNAKVPNIKFILVAPEELGGADSVPIEYITDAVSKNANFIWLGGRSDMNNIYCISNLSVLPSYYSEGGYPRALLEAMSFGLPVIAADTDLCRGPVEEGVNGYLVKPKDASDLAAKIIDILVDANLYKSMSAQSSLRVKEFFDDKLVVQHLNSFLID